MATSTLFANVKSPALLPQAPVGSARGYNAPVQVTGVLPLPTGQTSIAAAGKSITLYTIKRNISVLK
jgi:hypothetical protein